MNDNKINNKQNNGVSHNVSTKVCSKCNRELSIDKFRYIHSKIWSSYYLGHCKDWEHKYQRNYLENERKIKFSDTLEILVQRQYKEIKPERILDLSLTKVIPIGTDEIFAKLMDYKDYWISSYGRMIHYINGEYSLLTGGYDNYGVLNYKIMKNVLSDGKWTFKRKTFYAPRTVVNEFIVNPDVENNTYIWHSGFNKEDNYYRNLYPLNKEQYKIVKRNFTQNGDDSEEFILNVMNDIKYKPDNWSKQSLKPRMCGVGYWGSDDVNCTAESYLRWHDMIHRCYNDKFHSRQEQYSNCEVCEEWKNYSNFKIWYENTVYHVGNEQMDIDKDILFKGNKIYSPQTCCIVPHSINTLFLTGKKNRGDLPLGVYFEKDKEKYRACMNYHGIQIKLGTFDDPAAAFAVYKEYKEKFIKDIAEKYRGRIPDKVYQAMMKWKIEIDD